MSAVVNKPVTDTFTNIGSNGTLAPEQHVRTARNQNKNYKGFVAGVFSGIAKLSGKLDLLPCPNSKVLFE